MKKFALRVFFVAMALAISVIPAQSFNPAAHVYIADQIFQNHPNKTDLYYGSIAPDMAMYTDEAKWFKAKGDPYYPFMVTHYPPLYIDLKNVARGANQKAFAKGWFTHNELNGADHIAHGGYDSIKGYYTGGYVTDQALLLIGDLSYLGFDNYYLDFAHFAIEAAIDLLLKEQYDHSLGAKLLFANFFRSPLDRELLTRVLKNETDWITLLMTELTFRNLVHQYASALTSPKPFDALVNLGVQLAQQQFGIPATTATPELLTLVLDAAIQRCLQTGYYVNAIDFAIQALK